MIQIEGIFMKRYIVIVGLLLELLNIAHTHTSSEQKIMSYEEYVYTKHILPYLFTLHQADQNCYYFGADHSWDATHRQYVQLQSFWDDFLQTTDGKNCVVLVEGSLRNLHDSATTTQAIRRAGGEGGFITFLAQQAGICVKCPEPSEQILYQQLQKQFCQEHIAYTYLAQAALSAIRSKKGNNHVSLQEYVEACGAKNQGYFSIPLTVETFKKIHHQLFDAPFTLEDEEFFYQITNPTATDSVINSICRQKSIVRDLHIVEYINKLKALGKNVFIVYGCTHAVMQEKALRSLWQESS